MEVGERKAVIFFLFLWTLTSYKYILSETNSVELYERFNE